MKDDTIGRHLWLAAEYNRLWVGWNNDARNTFGAKDAHQAAYAAEGAAKLVGMAAGHAFRAVELAYDFAHRSSLKNNEPIG